MPQFQSYGDDTPVPSDNFLFYKATSSVLKNVSLSNLATAIRGIISSFFTSAAVVPSATPASGQILVGNTGGTAYAKQTVSGDLGLTNSGVATIQPNSVSYAKMQDVSSGSRLLGRGSSGAGDPQELSLGSNLSISGTTLNVNSGTGNVIQSSNASEANHVHVSGGADKSRVETPVKINPSNGDIEGIGDMQVGSVITPTIALTTTHASDDTGKGIIISDINAGESISQWDPVYYSFSDGEWMKADANGSGTYPAQGLAMASATNGNPLEVLILGSVRNDSWSWVAGPVYLSTSAGLTQSAPSSTGEIVQVVGFAKSADVAIFHFNSTYLTVA